MNLNLIEEKPAINVEEKPAIRDDVEEKPEIKDDVKVIQLDKKHKSKDTQEAKKIVSSEDEDQLPKNPKMNAPQKVSHNHRSRNFHNLKVLK